MGTGSSTESQLPLTRDNDVSSSRAESDTEPDTLGTVKGIGADNESGPAPQGPTLSDPNATTQQQ